jgi:hypothetical protein
MKCVAIERSGQSNGKLVARVEASSSHATNLFLPPRKGRKIEKSLLEMFINWNFKKNCSLIFIIGYMT